MRRISSILSVSCLSVATALAGQSGIVSASSFQQVAAKINKFAAKSGPKTLLVFDLDDTLLTMPDSNPLGGVGWWNWQTKMLSSDSKNNNLVANNFSSLLKDQYYLFATQAMLPTDVNNISSKYKSAIPSLLHNWYAADSYKIIIATARGPGAAKATFKELTDNDITASGQVLFKKSGLKINNYSSWPQFSEKCLQQPGRKIAYDNGVLFLSGGNKGMAAQCLLKHSKWQPQKIVFVDDTLKNDVEFAKKYSELQKKGDLLVIHYTHENAKEANFMLNKKLQNKCAQEWRNM